jgi:hypothetical protein
MGEKQFGIDNKRLMQYAKDIQEISEMNVEIYLEVFKLKRVVWIEPKETIWEC